MTLALVIKNMTYHFDTFKKTYRLYQNGRLVASYHHLADILSAFPDAEEV